MTFENEEGVDAKRRIGRDCHSSSCYDDEGKCECVCGLDEWEHKESNREPEDALPARSDALT